MATIMIRPFTAWAYRANREDLNRRAQEGWRLTKAGFLRYTFERDESGYRYDLDYCPAALGHDEWQRRLALYAESGWKLVNATATGWVYYEKPYDPSLPADAYRLPTPYTPEQEKLIGTISLFFWLRIVILAVGLVLAVLAVVCQKAMVLPAVIYLLFMLLLFFRMQALQDKLKIKK